MSELQHEGYLTLTVKDSTTKLEGEATVIQILAMIDALVNLVHNEYQIPIDEILETFKPIEDTKH